MSSTDGKPKVIVCINASGMIDSDGLTVGNKYQVIREDQYMYTIIDDTGREGQYRKSRFSEMKYEDPNGDN